MAWTKASIVQKLRQLDKAGQKLSYSQLAKRNQKLLSAAVYHFGSYRSAVEKAGIDYANHLRRPHWTKQNIIALIKKAKRKGTDLHWSAVSKRRDELGRAAFASLQPRLFKTWARALHAAGLDADEVQRYRHWNPQSIAFELRSRAAARDAVNSGAVQAEDPSLHAAALRHFKSFDKALAAARIDPDAHRRRQAWTEDRIRSEIKRMSRREPLTSARLRRENMPLYGAMLRRFGSLDRVGK